VLIRLWQQFSSLVGTVQWRGLTIIRRVRESAESEHGNAMGALAIVPAPNWEQRDAELKAAGDAVQGGAPADLEQTSKLAEVGGLEGLRGRTNPLTQVLTSVESFIAKIDQDIAMDSTALIKEKNAAPAVHNKEKLTTQGLEVVPEYPAPPIVSIPAITSATTGDERQRILDVKERRALQKVQHRLAAVPHIPVHAKPHDRWKAGSHVVSADLDAAEAAIDSIDAFTGNLPATTAEYLSTGSGTAAHTSAMSAAPAEPRAKPRADDRAASDVPKLDPSAPNPSVKSDSFKEEQQRALRQTIHDGSRLELTATKPMQQSAQQQDVDVNGRWFGNPFTITRAKAQSHESEVEQDEAQHLDRFAHSLQEDNQRHHQKVAAARAQERRVINGLHERESQTRQAFKRHEQEQTVQDREHEKHLTHELAQDKKAEKIALEHKETTNEIERVEAHMQNKASEHWEDAQEARKRTIIKESDELAQHRWSKMEQDEKAKESLYQAAQKVDKYMSPVIPQNEGHGEQDVREKWEQEELQGIAKLEATRKEAEVSMAKRIVLARQQQEVQAQREETIMGEKLVERKKYLHEEALQHSRVAAWHAKIEEEKAAHLRALVTEQKQDTEHAELRVAAIQKEDTARGAAQSAEQQHDTMHGNKVVMAAESAAAMQAAQKSKMVKEEETFREQALHEISKEEKDLVAKKEAMLKEDETLRQHELAQRDAAASRKAHEEQEQLHNAGIQRSEAFAEERSVATHEERALLRERQMAAARHEEEMEARRKAVDRARRNMAAELRVKKRVHKRKLAAQHLVLDAQQADHEIALAQHHSAAAEAELLARGVGGAMSMSQIIAKTAAGGAPKALAQTMVRALRSQVCGFCCVRAWLPWCCF